MEEKDTAEGGMAWRDMGPALGPHGNGSASLGGLGRDLGGTVWCLGPNSWQARVFGILGVPPTPLLLPSPRSASSLPAVHLRERVVSSGQETKPLGASVSSFVLWD